MFPLSFIFLFTVNLEPSKVTVPVEHIETTKEMATRIADEYNLDTKRFLKVIECESSWNEYAKGDYVNEQPTSFGLAQLHYPTRDWGIATSSAYVPEIALTLMAKAWHKGEAWRWTCFSLTSPTFAFAPHDNQYK